MSSSPARFLVAARRCEIVELEQLLRTTELTRRVGECVHALQKERGLSNLWLRTGSAGIEQARVDQIERTREAGAVLRAAMDALDPGAGPPGHAARLFSRMAYALQGLEALHELRARIDARALPAPAAVQAFVKLIAALLSVVFEAADSAADPAVSRLLVAMFHFLQGKEFAGQERATGAAAFAGGRADAGVLQHWQHLVESQERCFAVFSEFAGAAAIARWREAESGDAAKAVRGLRARVAQAAHGRELAKPHAVRAAGDDRWPAAPREALREVLLDASQSRPWFDACTARIDAMQNAFERLADDLRALSVSRLDQARADLRERDALLADGRTPPGAFFDDGTEGETPKDDDTTPALGPELGRSVLALVQEQSRRLQAMSDELDSVRATLSERKLVERAKGLLMAHRKLSESDAHKMLRQTAMNQNRRLVDVAESVLGMAEYLSDPRVP